jgi:cellulose synthase/poly-beta-1,6-N-acetylglucosamine synthase-like glycosyltransferase
LQACLDFAERQDKADIGQGIIHANDQPFWTNPLITVYDVSRVVENWGRLWTFYWTGNPVGGMHGSFAFVNGAVENAVTWETESIIEDYWFARAAHGRGYRFGFIPGIAREQSPSTIGDCLKQRQRWFAGVYQNGHIRPYLNQAALIWAPVQYLL